MAHLQEGGRMVARAACQDRTQLARAQDTSTNARRGGSLGERQPSWNLAGVRDITRVIEEVGHRDGVLLFIPRKQFDLTKTLYRGASKADDRIELPVAKWKQGVLFVSPGMLKRRHIRLSQATV